jgi:hypothetical protein
VVGEPGFSDVHGALARWFEVDGRTVGVLGEGAPAPAVGDEVTVEIVVGAHGFEGALFGGFRWTGPRGRGRGGHRRVLGLVARAGGRRGLLT